MISLSRPIGYGALCILLVGVWMWSNAEPSKVAKASTKTSAKPKSKEANWDFPPELTATHFDKPGTVLRNIFKPLVANDKPVVAVDEIEMMKVPAKYAEGEANWAYTGMVEVDGVRMALLENSASHQAGYVKEGETWKKSSIVHIDTTSIVFAGPDGVLQTVFRFNASAKPKPKPVPDPGFRPMDLSGALKGNIGPDIQIDRIKPGPKTSAPPPVSFELAGGN